MFSNNNNSNNKTGPFKEQWIPTYKTSNSNTKYSGFAVRNIGV